MKVLYDHQIFEHQRIGGVSRYFSEIIKHLPSEIDVDVSVQYSFNEYLKSLNLPFSWRDQLISYNNFLPNVNFRGKKRIFKYLEKTFPSKYPDLLKINRAETIKKIQSGDFDVFHPTFFDDYFLDYIGEKPYVLTVHDMIIELYPEFINSPVFVKRKKTLVDKAAHIIAVSENTKNDLIKVFNTPAEKISVTYHGASLDENDSKPMGLPEKYLLYVGDRRLGYKNFSFFISSIVPILKDNPDLYVVCTGESFNSQEKDFFKLLGIEDQIKLIFVDDKQMYGLYKSAQMFIYPSYYEGFGIPILEAFQAGCPVVLSDRSCFPEVAGNSGIFFESKSPIALREAILNLMSNADLRKEMVEKGLERLKFFSWENTAKQTIEVYKKVLNSI